MMWYWSRAKGHEDYQIAGNQRLRLLRSRHGGASAGGDCMISVTLSQLTDILNGELQGADITLML